MRTSAVRRGGKEDKRQEIVRDKDMKGDGGSSRE